MAKAGIRRRRCFKAKTLGPGLRRDDEELSALRLSVIPASAGIHCDSGRVEERTATSTWIPAFAGMTAMASAQRRFSVHQSQRRTRARYASYAAPNIAESAHSSGRIWYRVTYAMYNGTPTNAAGCRSQHAQATSSSAWPRYIGLRDTPCSPVVNNVRDDAGRSGFTVVPARPNASFGKRFNSRPSTVSDATSVRRSGDGRATSAEDHACAIPQATAPHRAITTGGGTRVSSRFRASRAARAGR